MLDLWCGIRRTQIDFKKHEFKVAKQKASMQRKMSTFGESRIKTLPLLCNQKSKRGTWGWRQQLVCVFFVPSWRLFSIPFSFLSFVSNGETRSFFSFLLLVLMLPWWRIECVWRSGGRSRFFYSSSFPSPFQNMGFPVLASDAVRSPWQTGESENHRKFKTVTSHFFSRLKYSMGFPC